MMGTLESLFRTAWFRLWRKIDRDLRGHAQRARKRYTTLGFRAANRPGIGGAIPSLVQRCMSRERGSVMV